MAHKHRMQSGSPEGENEGELGDILASQIQVDHQGVDDLLDEIDGLLETNAEEFVRSYIQKGGE
ncbi:MULTISPECIES: ubiquitin-like protein Pup [unclassified Corynebacterium]|uniref:ubiquitin-like protein Pup n=1 Tax=unclassified Corynebacterium TaxID=2624378 RepID=UPI0021683D93|nr:MULTISPECIES: ubiquitin-like protein Pup [unclassified Corynebacterium]MCS4489342.1 ubiquitin-like protein Pup [Corynebacterium sp. ES2775-CONJ]MCS4491155.1 ubiquitin-like protein Pup [Corynebacterium sp. ES2715-CONJ3]